MTRLTPCPPCNNTGIRPFWFGIFERVCPVCMGLGWIRKTHPVYGDPITPAVERLLGAGA